MKHILYSAAALLAFTACSGFLDEAPTVSLSQKGLYDSEKMLEVQVDGILGRFITQTSFTGELTEYSTLASGIFHHGINGTSGYAKPYYASLYKLTQYSGTQKNNASFGACFNIIASCNILLSNLEASPVNGAYKDEVAAEVRFYRAYAMFKAVKIWGDIPVKTQANSPDNVDQARAPYYEVYAAIVNDLKEAEAGMRSPARAEEACPGRGRVNKYAATALLSSVYTTIGSLLSDTQTNFWDESDPLRRPDFSKLGINTSADAYTLALQTAEKLIPESGSFDPGSPYRLAEKFGDLFNWDPAFSRDSYTAWTNPERIFVLPVTNTCNCYLGRYTLPAYPEGIDATAQLQTSNNGRWRPSRWAFQKWCETYPGEKVASSTFDIYKDSADPRLGITMYKDSVFNESTKTWRKIYPAPSVITVKDGANINAQVVHPYLKKYWSRNYQHDGGEADVYLIRLAEVYLNAAEAAAALGQEGKAYAYIEVLHARARHSVPDGEPDALLPKWESGRFSSSEELRSAIFWERVFELMGEGHEYDDTHRFGATWMSENITKPKNAFLRLPEQDCFWWGGYVFPHDKQTREPYQYPEDPQELRKSLLYAYPNQELNYNDALGPEDQNDYWWNM